MPPASHSAPDRRTEFRGGAVGLPLFTLGGCDKPMIPREAREQDADEDSSVTDSFGRRHDIANLCIAGPGLFPTGCAMNSNLMNSNFTNHAVSLRGVEHLIGNWPK